MTPLDKLLEAEVPLDSRLVDQVLLAVGFIREEPVGKFRSWKHPDDPNVLTYREEPSGQVVYSKYLRRIKRHLGKVTGRGPVNHP